MAKILYCRCAYAQAVPEGVKNDVLERLCASGAAFECVPDALLSQFGEPVLVIELELSIERKLARENVETVMRNLRERGFHLQMPPKLQPDLYEGNPI